ncbi:ABC transporter-like protein [Exophiala viscosa]|uniref:ABC transporter-like protein n=1 Tax=Exophiala viscosa TaxID=2486360 RepID=A0AAN6I9C6_9EURO|nr:ABC transporter-like protein [Exophiala viscosa]KAI1620832.1 ABC transporter-like protein [Exophiala viscosa]
MIPVNTLPGSSTPESLRDSKSQNIQVIDVRIRNVAVEVDSTAGSPFSSLDAFKLKILRSKVKPAVKDILKNVSADFPNSSLTAIVGASGSGKTTLLNIIAHRIKDQKFRQAGSVTYEAVTDTTSEAAAAKIGMAYVLQQDILLPTLTVRETLQYAADLRLSTTKTKAERRAMVETVINELGLEKCANTRIGNDAHKGCSGGEKRRTSIGVQLLADQPVLILDEPTTGLDAASAIQVVQTLRLLARRGKTVIMTIHQPRSEIWRLVDNLVLLSRGSPVYAGAVNECLPYFEQLGHSMPAFSNPFDFVIDLAAVDVRSHELERVSLLRVRQLQEAWRSNTSSLAQDDSEKTPSKCFERNQLAGSDNSLNALVLETGVHLRRTFVVTCRDRLGLLASLIEAVTMGIMTGWIFYQLPTDLAGIRSREGAMYSACALQGYLILLFETYRLTIDIQVYDRERIEGVVKPLSFVFSRRFARLLLEDLPVPFIYSVIFYFMAGFRADARQYFTFFAIQLLLQLITVNLATICVALNRQFMVASLIANLIFTLQSAACGFFINTKSIPIWLRWMKWVAFVFYSFGAYCTNEFAGHFYGCPSPGGPSDPACKEYTGAYILASLNIPNNWLWRPIIVMVAFVLVFFVLSAVTLHVLTTEVEMAKTHASEISYSEEDIRTTSSGDSTRTITVALDQFGLAVETKRPFKSTLTKPIFQDISTTFEPGVLNVIMGPSGSGKSSCLNAMARRLYGSPMTAYRSSGRMLLNGAMAADNVVASICSYVPQDDTGLLPSLTVRETLHFAARLRLPTFLTNEQKVQRAETVLRQLGLKECADTLVGNDLVKGISGGEKRRVSIGIQILTDPRVLLLDEPTSGLDAFTAFSIIEVLKGLADEGRTIIFSIHQPRSDMFKQFGGVLLLAKGGDVVYSGKVDNMLPHFERLGYACPESANPADFALDIVSVEMPKSLQQQSSPEISDSPTDKNIPTGVVPPTLHEVELTFPAILGVYTRTRLPFRRAFPILVQRGIINLRRQPELASGRISQLVGLGIVLTAFFTPLRYEYYSVQTRAGYIQYMSSMFFVGMLNAIAMYPSERDIYYHEDRDGTYPLEAFYLYYSALEVPMELIASLLYAVLTVFAVGLPRTAAQFFLMAYTAFCLVSCGESFGILFLTMFSHTGLAVSVMSVVLSISVHLGGVLSIGIDGFLQGVNHISPVKWQVGALMSYSFRGIEFTCTVDQRLSDGSCPIQSGEQVLDLYKLNVNTATCAIALGGVTIGYRLLGYLGLKIRKTDWKGLMRRGKITKS